MTVISQDALRSADPEEAIVIHDKAAGIFEAIFFFNQMVQFSPHREILGITMQKRQIYRCCKNYSDPHRYRRKGGPPFLIY